MSDDENKMNHDVEDLRQKNEEHDQDAGGVQSTVGNEHNETDDDLEALNYMDEPQDDDKQEGDSEEIAGTSDEEEKLEDETEVANEQPGEVTEEALDESSDVESTNVAEEVETHPDEVMEEHQDNQPEESSNEVEGMEEILPVAEEVKEEGKSVEEELTPVATPKPKKEGSHPPLVIVIALVVMFLLVAVAVWAYQDSKDEDQSQEAQTSEVITPATEEDLTQELKDVDAVIIELDGLGSPEDLPADAVL